MATAPRVDVIMGGIIGTVDTWTTKISYAVTGGVPSQADMNGIASGFATLWAVDFWDTTTVGMKANVNSTTSWNLCKTYYYPAGATVATVSGLVSLTNDPGTAGAAPAPPQCAIVASLHTAFSGRKNRGRCYMPSIVPYVGVGAITPTQALRIATQFRLFLHDTNSATVGALSFNACIGTGSLPSVTSVVVDTVVDTQRRRRDKQTSSGTAVVAV